MCNQTPRHSSTKHIRQQGPEKHKVKCWDYTTEERMPTPFKKVIIQEIPLELKVKDIGMSTCLMAIDDLDTVKDDLAEDEPPPASEVQAWDETEGEITGEEPTMKLYFYPLSLYQCKNMAINTCHLHFGQGRKGNTI